MNNESKIISMKLSHEDLRRLEELKKTLGENQSQVLKRALNNLYDKYEEEN